MIRTRAKEAMHPRNRFRGGYDFEGLLARSRELRPFVKPNPHGDPSIDYADPRAVKALNQALLKQAHGLWWDLPEGYLCPPVPGRTDALHYVADLLAGKPDAAVPRGSAVRVLDVGMGANCIYPLLGASEYGWRFVGSEIDPVALRWAETLVAKNPAVGKLIECRLQPTPSAVFAGVIRPGETFDLSMCNPPFHTSAREAAGATARKQRNLGTARGERAVKNFGGGPSELWCPGGEVGFVRRMIAESLLFKDQCRWFTSLVSRSEHLPRLEAALRAVGPPVVKTIEMAQGQKRSRLLAWTFQAV